MKPLCFARHPIGIAPPVLPLTSPIGCNENPEVRAITAFFVRLDQKNYREQIEETASRFLGKAKKGRNSCPPGLRGGDSTPSQRQAIGGACCRNA